MAFETIVRPVVFPNIRPAPARALAPEDDPEKGKAVLGGSGGGVIDVSYSWSVSVSRSKGTEGQRRVDEVRIYQKSDEGGAARSGTVNRDNYVDVEVANKIWVDQPDGPSEIVYQRIQGSDSIEIMRRDVIKKGI